MKNIPLIYSGARAINASLYLLQLYGKYVSLPTFMGMVFLADVDEIINRSYFIFGGNYIFCKNRIVNVDLLDDILIEKHSGFVIDHGCVVGASKPDLGELSKADMQCIERLKDTYEPYDQLCDAPIYNTYIDLCKYKKSGVLYVKDFLVSVDEDKKQKILDRMEDNYVCAMMTRELFEDGED